MTGEDTDTDRIGGIMPVPYSIFEADEALRHSGYLDQVDNCLASGATGCVLFGFVTQFYKLTLDEKIAALDSVARHIGGRGTLGVTIMEPTIEGQLALVQAVERAGATWLILQPPLGPRSAGVGGCRS